MTQAEIKQYVYDFLYDKGLPHISICALMGNITGESSWNVDAIENGSGVGFGLCQWSYSRRTQLEAYGTTLTHQCEFLWSELTGKNTNVTGASYQWIANPADSVDNGEGFSFTNANFLSGNGTLATLTKAFCYCWERPAYATNHLNSLRIPSAEEFYNSMSYSGSGGGSEEPDEPDEPQYNGNEIIIESAINWAVAIANDNSHGYDQTKRWGPDYDCSSLLIQAYQNAGSPVKTKGATYTGNMVSAFKKCGFSEIAYTSGMELLAGDVLWRKGHTAMYIGSGNIVSAHINEKGTTTGGATGDQTSGEINVSAFSSSGNWTKVLRLPVIGEVNPEPDEPRTKRKQMSLILMYMGSKVR